MADKTDEEKEQTAIAVRTNLEMTPTGLVLTNLDEMYRFAQYVSASPFAPKDMRDPVSIVVAIQYGAELGLSMMAALANIAVINGKPSVYGDVMLALVRASGLLEDFSEGLVVKLADGKLACQCAKWAREGECIHSRAAVIPFSRPGEERVGVCFAKRKGTNEGTCAPSESWTRRSGLSGARADPGRRHPTGCLCSVHAASCCATNLATSSRV